MPYYSRKKRYKKRKQKRKNNRMILYTSKVLGGFPDRARTRLKYCQEIYLDPAIAVHVHRFRCNSIYDPDAESGGHQPANYAVWFARYQNATVLRSSIKITCVNPTTPTISTIGGCLLAKDINACTGLYSLGGYPAILEQRYSTPNTVTYGTRTATNLGAGIMRQKFSAASFFDRSQKAIINSADFSHEYNNNPAEQAYWHVWNASVAGSNGGRQYYVVEILYDIAFSQPSIETPGV